VAVSNRDLLDFLLSPIGMLYGVFVASLTAALLLGEQAGFMALANRRVGSGVPRPAHVLATFVGVGWRVATLGAAKVVLLIFALAPFTLLVFATYTAMLSRHDINFYLQERPPRFWVALGIGAGLVLVAALVGLWLFVRWSLALPILLFERQPAGGALRASRDRVRGATGRLAVAVLAWPLTALLLSPILAFGFRELAEWALADAGERPILRILALLALQAGLFGGLTFAAAVGQALMIRRIYLTRRGNAADSATPTDDPCEAPSVLRAAWPRRLALAGVGIVLLAPLVGWLLLPRQLAALPGVKITAHRGHSRAAPENTLSAIRKAIEAGADYAEIDVQRTADGVVVLLHDRDLKRVAGDARRLDTLHYDEVRQLDVGSWFGPEFAGERLPTLAEAIHLARGKIKLNIELKYYGDDPELAPAVARLLRAEKFEHDCVVTSFNLAALQSMKQIDPDIRIGLIVGQALGNLGRVEIDLFSVRADFLPDSLIRSARRTNREIHVWTVNDAPTMNRLIKRGVHNLITDDPDLGVRVRDEWSNLSAAEQVVLASRLLLGLNP
jgi:glycerophosphoryl diester phosphodiesterase